MEQRNIGTGQNRDAIPAALTIAGSDSGGGAGIQADLRTFAVNGVFGTSAITAVTSQNPLEVLQIDPLPPGAVACQIRSVLKCIGIRAIKTGMLFSAEIIHAVAEELKESPLPLIVDPVMISTSGSKLLAPEAYGPLMEELLPLAAWVTPNIPEAEVLAGSRIVSSADAVRAANIIADRWNVKVLLKGGHAEGTNEAADIICCGNRVLKISSSRLPLPPHASHGTGCTLSAALTAFLAKGMNDLDALVQAKAFILGSLAEARLIGKENREIAGMFPPSDPEIYRKRILIGEI